MHVPCSPSDLAPGYFFPGSWEVCPDDRLAAPGILRKCLTSRVRARGVGVALQRSAATQAPSEAQTPRAGGRIAANPLHWRRRRYAALHARHVPRRARRLCVALGRRVRHAGITLLSKPFTVEAKMEVVGRIAERAS